MFYDLWLIRYGFEIFQLANNEIIAEFDRPSLYSTLNIEFLYLSDITGDERYRQTVQRAWASINKTVSPRAMFRNTASLDIDDYRGGSFSPYFSSWPDLLSESGGNYIDYTLKAWLKGGRKDETLRKAFIEAAEYINKTLLKTEGEYKYIGVLRDREAEKMTSHSFCYLGNVFTH